MPARLSQYAQVIKDFNAGNALEFSPDDMQREVGSALALEFIPPVRTIEIPDKNVAVKVRVVTRNSLSDPLNGAKSCDDGIYTLLSSSLEVVELPDGRSRIHLGRQSPKSVSLISNSVAPLLSRDHGDIAISSDGSEITYSDHHSHNGSNIVQTPISSSMGQEHVQNVTVALLPGDHVQLPLRNSGGVYTVLDLGVYRIEVDPKEELASVERGLKHSLSAYGSADTRSIASYVEAASATNVPNPNIYVSLYSAISGIVTSYNKGAGADFNVTPEQLQEELDRLPDLSEEVRFLGVNLVKKLKSLRSSKQGNYLN